MVVDLHTLHDLDVLSTSTRKGPTLWSLVDRTRTRAGREQLRRRLVAPNHSAEEIVALQRAHQEIAATAPNYRAMIDGVGSDGVERYLHSNWQLPHATRGLTQFVTGLWRPSWFRQYLREVADGQARIVAVLRGATDLSTQLSAAHSPVLQNVGAALSAQLAEPDALELLRLGSRPSAAARLAFDRLARDTAKPRLTAILDGVASIEAMWSLAVATAEHEWSYPRPASQLHVVGLFHPFLGQDAITNDLHVGERVRVCFVTGPNMAGKSTFLKALAVAVLLAHAGCGVPAASMEFRIVGTIFSSIQIVDNLTAGESFYLAEVRRIKALAVALENHGSGVAVLDEPFRGTNVHDAVEATSAVIARLLDRPDTLVFVASHLAEVVPAFIDDPRIRLLHFSADMAGERPLFDYRLREGISDQRLGMTLLRQEEVLDLLERSAGVSRLRLAPAAGDQRTAKLLEKL